MSGSRRTRRWAAAGWAALLLTGLLLVWSPAHGQECAPAETECEAISGTNVNEPPFTGGSGVGVGGEDPGVGTGNVGGAGVGGSGSTGGGGSDGASSTSTGDGSSRANSGSSSSGSVADGAAVPPEPSPDAAPPSLSGGAPAPLGPTDVKKAPSGSAPRTGRSPTGPSRSATPVVSDPALGELATGAERALGAPPEEPPVVVVFADHQPRTGWPVVVFIAGAALVVAGLMRRRSAVPTA